MSTPTLATLQVAARHSMVPFIVRQNRQRRRAVAALTPTWPQERTFTRREVDEHHRAVDAWERRHREGAMGGPILTWRDDLVARAARAGIPSHRLRHTLTPSLDTGAWTIRLEPEDNLTGPVE